MSNFRFLKAEWPELHEAAGKAEALANPDPRAACFYTRRALELAVAWLYKHEAKLKLPYLDNLSALIHEPTFKTTVGDAVFAKARLLQKLGNEAVHSTKPIRQFDAHTAVRELFHIAYWLAHTYARGAKPAPGLVFDPAGLPKGTAIPAHTLDQLQRLETQLREKDEKLKELLSDKITLDEELVKLRAEVAAAKQANTATRDAHDYSEAETRDYFIDLLLREAGWTFSKPGHDTEFPVTGMPNTKGEGFVDYVLWGDDGKPLGLVEAKRTKKDARVGQRQAELYADCLEKQFGQRPVIFYSNGYEHWLWDNANYPPREVQGFFKKDELELLIQRRTTRQKLADAKINEAIVERYYQTRAIRRIGEAFEKDCDRKALVVMATGAGKTRTVIALADLLMRSNWAKRVLFLADRVALVNQAVKAFSKHFPESSPVNLVTEKEAPGRVFLSTYPTMMGLIDEAKDGQRRFGVGHFDLIIIDEAHRSVFQKYRAIFDYFDSLLVGLTATPKDEVDRNTYDLFDLEDGVPTDAYPLDEAVVDKFLVPARPISVPLKYQRDGIKYADLSEEEKEQWDAKEWDDSGVIPTEVDSEAVNKWLFNENTVDKVLAHLMTRGQKVAGGDRLGKTIIFAKNNDHAEYIAERFNIHFPHYKGEFARVITFKTAYAQTLIGDFSIKDKAPHIAISVDMLDTGIDVPEVVNLVFFKLVKSKTKFWQMLGRGTRLCPDLFGPDRHKKEFYLFDYCGNLEFFNQNPEGIAGNTVASLGERLFTTRLGLISELDLAVGANLKDGSDATAELRKSVAELLRTEVAAMNVDNFIVRPHRRQVEEFAKPEAWQALGLEAMGTLAHTVAGLPNELASEDEEAKRFDLLMLKLQLAVLRVQPAFQKLSEQVRAIAGLLEEKSSIPMIQQELALIEAIQTDEWWQDVTVALLESARKHLRLLIKLIEKKSRKPIYTNFEDSLGPETEVAFSQFAGADNFERFRAKVRDFLKEHENHVAIHKLRLNEPLTALDLKELEGMLVKAGFGGNLEQAKEEAQGLGLFVRSLVGLDREAAKKTFAVFLVGRALTASQIEFINLIIDHLTAKGVMDPAQLYESPFTDVNSTGPEGIFEPAQITKLIDLLQEVRQRAIA